MNLSDERYTRYQIVGEMLETVETVKGFRVEATDPFVEWVRSGRVLLTGEGSSRIFPAKNAIYRALRNKTPLFPFTEGAAQAAEYDLTEAGVFAASNSGRTKEVVALVRKLQAEGHRRICALSASAGTPIERESSRHYRLGCGTERAVAATKSVVEQALFYDTLFRRACGGALPDLSRLSDAMRVAMETPVPRQMVERIAAAPTVYWAGRNDGVAEELTLKSNEIARKKADFLEGTYAVHGIEEVMERTDALVIIDPFAGEQEKFAQVLQQGVGLALFAVSDRATPFPTLSIPTYPEFQGYIELAAGWNLLVEVGLERNIDLDRTARARKVGNELVE